MRSQLVTLARGLTDGAVDDHIYRICAAVLSGQRAQNTRLMKGLQRIGEGIFTADDWQWLSEPIPALYQAAGENGHRNGTKR
ncbi:MAG: hypothetical protein GY842_03010 [bacterium]|nr:hypothetical protein [bacterium]